MIPGLEILLTRHPGWLRGKRVALLSHQAAVTTAGQPSAEALRDLLGPRLVALLGPEHGYYGAALAGEHVHTFRHPEWDIPVHSLYGGQRAPTPEVLENVDVLVCDLQDLGARCYTYLATLKLAIQACAENNVEVIVCDRPIPLPCVVDGPVALPQHDTFVSPAGFPVCTGMTPGETAVWLTQTSQSSQSSHPSHPPRLRVAWMQGWSRSASRPGGGPEFIAPSPSLRTWESTQAYLATVFAEAFPALDIGRGTNMGFRVLAAPFINARRLIQKLNAEHLPGVQFHPHTFIPAEGPRKGAPLEGVKLTVTDPNTFKPVWTSLVLLDLLGPSVWQTENARPAWFDQLYGGPGLREALMAGADRVALHALCHAGHGDYHATRAEALHYPPRLANPV